MAHYFPFLSSESAKKIEKTEKADNSENEENSQVLLYEKTDASYDEKKEASVLKKHTINKDTTLKEKDIARNL